EWSKFVTDVKLAKGEDPIECINKSIALLSAVASRFSPSNNQLITSSNPKNQATIHDGRVTVQQCTQPKRPRNVAWFKEKLMLVEAQEAGQILDEEQLAFLADPNCDDLSSVKAVLMANLSSCDPEVLSEAQRIQPALYDGSVIAKEHTMISVTGDEETLILEEESRSKMLDKQNDPISIEKKI
ncbi:hypothetical protein Tco_1081513, partial [Tanacetum coccineum]